MVACGAYYQVKPNAPINGLGAAEQPSVSLAEQTLQEMVVDAPIGGFVPWGEQVSDTAWSEAPREWFYALTPINGQIIKAVEKAAGNHPVPYVGILFDQPATLNAIDVAPFGSPYVREVSYGIYNAASKQEVPTIRFLIIARHRDTIPGDGAGGGDKSPDAVAANLNGSLVYAAKNRSAGDMGRPPVPFEVALQNQLGLQVPPQMVPTAAEREALAAEKRRQALLVAGVGLAAAIGVAWYVGRKKKGKRASSEYTSGAGI